MNFFSTSSAKSTRRPVVLMLLAALVATAGAGLVRAASGKADFNLAVTPATATAAQAQTATYTVSLSKANGFSSPVALTVSGLPGATKATFSPNPVVVGQSPGDKAVLTVQTNVEGTTPAGTSTLTITGVSGSLVHTAAVKLVVQPAPAPNFAIAAAPIARTLVGGDSTSYDLTVSRAGGFSGAVALQATNLPAGVTATISPSSVSGAAATALLETTDATPTGTHTVIFRGTAQVAGSTAVRTTTATLTVEKGSGFAIAGDVPGTLELGQSQPLDLSLTNPNNFDLKVSGITITVQESTGNAGCSGLENFRIEQIPPARFPITLPGDQTATLSQLGVAPAGQPQIEMLNLDRPQNACLGATVKLSYSGTATKR